MQALVVQAAYRLLVATQEKWVWSWSLYSQNPVPPHTGPADA